MPEGRGWLVSVYDDYVKHQFGRYFTPAFLWRHLLPGKAIPGGNYKASRERARAGNVHKNHRHQANLERFEADPRRPKPPLEFSSLIYDIDLSDPKSGRQILRLMNEVEDRNASGYYAQHAVAVDPIVTEAEYYIQTTASGSRQWFIRRPFFYKVQPVGGRFIINHYDGEASAPTE